MIAGLESGSDFGTRRERAQREAVGDAFGGDEDVGIDAIVLISKHFSSASKTGLNFVSDKQDAVLVENFLHFFEVIRRRHDDAAFTHHRLGDESSDVGRGCEADDVVDGAGALASTFFGIVAPLRSVGIGSRRKGHTCRVRATALLATLVAGDAERAPTASVEAGVEGDELVL